ncbi:hypothetical protein C8Q73DRAFT_713588 [Cubamyces lactineus]|nr:hypothetical protein C8Q73DRAFT_713588 [Cubamyces lactineus]
MANQSGSPAAVYSVMIAPPQAAAESSVVAQVLSKNGKHSILPEQGRLGMNTTGPINLDCWARYRGRDEDAEVFFAVYKSVVPTMTPRDLHWSLAWPISGTAAWRQIHVVTENMSDGPPPQPRYVYRGAMTKSAGPVDSVATRQSVGVFSLADRLRIEGLARETPVMVPDGT